MSQPGTESRSADIITDIHALVESGMYLSATDLAIRALNPECDEKSQRRVLKLMCRSALLSVKENVPENEGILDYIFHATLVSSSKRLLCLCLVRALSRNPDLFLDPALRNKTFIAFDSSLPDIYKELKIEPKRQTHEKEVALRSYVHDAEREVEEMFRPLERIEDAKWEAISHSRSDIAKLLKRYGTLVLTFVPRELLASARIDELFAAVKEYLEADDASALHTYERVKAVLSRYEQQAREVHTSYADAVCVRLADLLLSICQRKFDQSGAGKPARVVARPSDKKCPLHFVDQAISLGFYLENLGSGYARDLTCTLTTDGSVECDRGESFLGNLAVGSIAVEFPARVLRSVESVLLDVAWSWVNFDGSIGSDNTYIEVFGQPAGIDWDSLIVREPYKLEPVSSEEELVGRTDILGQLTAKAHSTTVGSTCLWGQRRVGKTSITKTLRTRLLNDTSHPVHVLFIEAGEYVHEQPHRTIEQLGTKICKRLALLDRRYGNIEIPRFDGALSPLSDFFDEVSALTPEVRILIMLDEFDLVPVELYRRGATGETFFATIRSLSQKGFIGFILVGGERMRYLFDCQGQALNKFQLIRVDYFDRAKHWKDYQDLITRPTKEWLQFTDSALLRIYDEAAGNPYYTVLICRSLFNLMVSRRDSHVTEKEAFEAIAIAVTEASTTNFQHFWDDAIVDSGVRAEEISMRRRYVLLSLSEAMGSRGVTVRSAVCECAKRYGLEARVVENALNEFVQREVLVESDGCIACKVPFFGRWLRTVGPWQIITTYTETEAVRLYHEAEEEAAVTSSELLKLLSHWGTYKGRRVTADDVRAWLEQFDTKSDQRLMFRLLQALRFYSEDEVRGYMRVAHGIVTRGLVEKVALKQVKRWQSVLVSYLDGPGKSGSRFAKLYIDENSMYHDSLIEKGQLAKVLANRSDIQAIVFIDDFVGTGRSAMTYLEEVIRDLDHVLSSREVRLFFISVSGFISGVNQIERHVATLPHSISLHTCDALDESHVCFSDTSSIFPEPSERDRAMDIAESKGKLLCKSAPLGYDNCQALIVFAHNCPNNTLPILWEKRSDWCPLFQRD